VQSGPDRPPELADDITDDQFVAVELGERDAPWVIAMSEPALRRMQDLLGRLGWIDEELVDAAPAAVLVRLEREQCALHVRIEERYHDDRGDHAFLARGNKQGHGDDRPPGVHSPRIARWRGRRVSAASLRALRFVSIGR
jgi:hypothetical protein